jgi:hypothetical protein
MNRNSYLQTEPQRQLVVRGASILISLAVVTLALALPASSQVVTAAQVNGTWRDRTKIFKVRALGKQKLKVEFQGTYEYRAARGLDGKHRDRQRHRPY